MTLTDTDGKEHEVFGWLHASSPLGRRVRLFKNGVKVDNIRSCLIGSNLAVQVVCDENDVPIRILDVNDFETTLVETEGWTAAMVDDDGNTGPAVRLP